MSASVAHWCGFKPFQTTVELCCREEESLSGSIPCLFFWSFHEIHDNRKIYLLAFPNIFSTHCYKLLCRIKLSRSSRLLRLVPEISLPSIPPAPSFFWGGGFKPSPIPPTSRPLFSTPMTPHAPTWGQAPKITERSQTRERERKGVKQRHRPKILLSSQKPGQNPQAFPLAPDPLL